MKFGIYQLKYISTEYDPLIREERNKNLLTTFYILCRHSPRCLTYIIIPNPHVNLASYGVLIPILQMGKLKLREV